MNSIQLQDSRLIYKNLFLSYILMDYQKEKTRKSLLNLTSKRTKGLGVNLMKGRKWKGRDRNGRGSEERTGEERRGKSVEERIEGA